MLTLSALQQQRQALIERIAEIEALLASIEGIKYRGCWIDSGTNSKGTVYYRKRWFDVVKGRRVKRAKVLSRRELASAQRAIALWAELEPLQSRLKHTEDHILEIQARIAALLG
jgi:threonyl-tRNA synthetase